jgi:hypothetical protein
MEKRINFNDNLFEDSYCLMCEDATIEDQDHAWKCDFALAQKQDIFNNAKALALKDLSKPNNIVSASTVNIRHIYSSFLITYLWDFALYRHMEREWNVENWKSWDHGSCGDNGKC